MSVLEKSVANLAAALDALETSLDSRLEDQGATSEDILAAKRQAKVAREHASEASEGLADAIKDLKTLIDRPQAGNKG